MRSAPLFGFTLAMTATAWIALIPIVACERMLYAAGIVVGHAVIILLLFGSKKIIVDTCILACSEC